MDKSRQVYRNQQFQERQARSQQLRDFIIDRAERARPMTFAGFGSPDIADMKCFGAVLREAGQMFSRNKQEMISKHKRECFARIQEIREVHNLWWQQLIGHRAQRHQDFRARVQTNLQKNYDQLSRAEAALSKAYSHADKLRSDIDSAWSDSFRDRAEGWLAETEVRISDIEAHIERIHGWIAENEAKLS